MQRESTFNPGNLILSLSEITDMANPFITRHQQRTAFIAFNICKKAGVDRQLVINTFTAALLHDIGALSIEEKTAIYKDEESNKELHCIRGEVLLSTIPWLSPVAPIIRHHHRKWIDWKEPCSEDIVFASQVILLADMVERKIDRNRHILHQCVEIIEYVKHQANGLVCSAVLKYFLEAAIQEEFWLDLISPHLYTALLDSHLFGEMEIDLKKFMSFAELCRNIIDFKSPYTATHTSGVSACAATLGQYMGFTEQEITLLTIAGNLHDVGKMIIPNCILEKPGKLTSQEYAIIRSHTYYTYQMLNHIGGIPRIAKWAAYHHEKLDGTGYPFRCTADELDIGARIITTADIFTAISEDRPYRPKMNCNQIHAVFQDLVNTHAVDPHLYALLFDNYEKINAAVRAKQFQAQSDYENLFSQVENEKQVN